MSLLAAPQAMLVRVVAIAICAISIGAFGAYLAHRYYAPELTALQTKYDSFVGATAALGRAAEIANAQKALHDIKNKERSDDENLRTRAATGALVKRLRDDADRARGSGLPAAPAGSKCPAEQVCFDRPLFERAQRDRREAVRGLVDEGTAVAIDLNTALKWATELRSR